MWPRQYLADNTFLVKAIRGAVEDLPGNDVTAVTGSEDHANRVSTHRSPIAREIGCQGAQDLPLEWVTAWQTTADLSLKRYKARGRKKHTTLPSNPQINASTYAHQPLSSQV